MIGRNGQEEFLNQIHQSIDHFHQTCRLGNVLGIMQI